jgi:predicted nucleotidyltransferase
MSKESVRSKLANDAVLDRFRQVLSELYGDRLQRVVLFGSRARGDARPDSDYDVAIFLKALPDPWPELDRLARLRVQMIDETGAFFEVMPYPAGAWQDRTPLMHDVRQDGIDL